MVLKLEACKRALSAGVAEVRIVGGSVPKGLLAAANGARFPGTRVTLGVIPPAPREWRGEIEDPESRQRSRSRFDGATAPNPVLRDAARHLMNTYKRSDMVFTHGQGCYVFDQHGKKYLDFLGGIAVNALGLLPSATW